MFFFFSYPTIFILVTQEGLGVKLSDEEFIRQWNVHIMMYSNTGDYAHYKITSAAILINDISILRIVANVATGGSEQRKDSAGWFGDATIPALDGIVSFKNDDYVADLDAVNITSIMVEQGLSLSAATAQYKDELQNGATRADLFLKHNDLVDIEKRILDKLHIHTLDQLRKEQPDAYNFIESLRNGLNEMRDYAHDK